MPAILRDLVARQIINNTDLPPPQYCTATIAVTATFLTTAWLSVILRFWTRAKIVRKIAWDDWFTLLSVCCFTPFCGSVINMAWRFRESNSHGGLGWNDLLTCITLLNVSEYFYFLTILTLKIGLGFFFLPLAVEHWQRIVIYVAVTLNTIMSVVVFFFAIFQCGYYTSTPEFLYRRIGLQGHCANDATTLGLVYTHGGITALTDWTFLLLPIVILRKSLMRVPEKLTIGAILMFASISGVAVIIRFRYISAFADVKTDFFAQCKDIAMWSGIEPGVGITAASIATLRPLVRFFVSSASGSRRRYVVKQEPRPVQPPNFSFIIPKSSDAGEGSGSTPKSNWQPVLSFISLDSSGSRRRPNVRAPWWQRLKVFKFRSLRRQNLVLPSIQVPHGSNISDEPHCQSDKASYAGFVELKRSMSGRKPDAWIENGSDDDLKSPPLPSPSEAYIRAAAYRPAMERINYGPQQQDADPTSRRALRQPKPSRKKNEPRSGLPLHVFGTYYDSASSSMNSTTSDPFE